MGQRSQIYIRTPILVRKEGNEYESVGKHLIARYFQWNYGERMISRAARLLEELEYSKKCMSLYYDQNDKQKLAKLERLCDVNFDFGDIVDSHNILSNLYVQENYSFNNEVFLQQDNNDGQLYLDIDEKGNIRFAFTDDGTKHTMSAFEYFLWDATYELRKVETPKTFKEFKEKLKEYEVWEDQKEYVDFKTLWKNIKSIDHKKNFKLMSNAELVEFIQFDYCRNLTFSATY